MSDYDLIIRGGSVVRPQGAEKLDLGIRDGQITALGNAVYGSTDADLDATDLHLLPGLVDPNVHFNEPGRTDWEGFEYGSRALAAGGYTAFLDMPLYADPPVLDKSGFLEKWNGGKANSLLDFGLWGGLTPASLPHLQDLTDCGVIGFKAYMCSSGVEEFAMADDATLFEGMQRACDLQQIVAVHAENDALTGRLGRRAVAEGRLSARDYLESRPVIAELEAIQRAILFAWETDCALHITHVSTARGADLVANAKAQGLNISCETCPHYLILTEADLERLQALAKCAPPLRGGADQMALWNQLAFGGIDMIASDHSSAPPERKFRGGDMFSAWGGIAGCQSTLPLMLTASAETTPPLPIETIADLLSTNVARRFRLHPAKGELQIGADADVAIVKLGEEHTLRAEALFNRYPEHSPYLGRQLYGRVLRTILRGQTIFNNGRIVAKPSARLLRPAEIQEL
jgi:allantoinase